MAKKSIWYDFSKVDGYNKLFNFIVGARGIGKSYGLKVKALKNYVKGDHQFIYLRRTEDEANDTAQKFYADIEKEFPEWEFIASSGRFYMYKKEWSEDDDFKKDDYVCGYYLPLTTAHKVKSISYPRVNIIMYDEFIPPAGGFKINNEPLAFLEFYNTVSRLRLENPVKAYFIANAMTETNDYFRFFNIKLSDQNKDGFVVKDEVLVHMAKSIAYKDEFKKTRFYKLIEGTTYEKYALDNEFLYDNNNFIEKVNLSDYTYLCTMTYENIYFGVYQRKDGEVMYINKKGDSQYALNFALDGKNHSKSTVLAKHEKNNFLFRRIKKYHSLGRMMFDSVDTKNIIEEKVVF